MLDLSRLTERQREATTAADGPVLILAGPGSGKTTVLAARVAWLVLTRSISPESILAITFTRAAARQLRTRLAPLLQARAASVDVTTFHAFGLRVVRQWWEELGFAREQLAVYGDDDVEKLVGQLLQQQPDLTSPLAEIAQQLAQFRLDGEIPPGNIDWSALAARYEDALRRRAAVDFAAMLSLPLRLFTQHPRALRLYEHVYRHVLADEFQDVSPPQYELLRQLSARVRNLTAVGDPAQTLFAWRGADVRLLTSLERDFPEVQHHWLDENLRSTKRIVAVSNTIGAGLKFRQPSRTENEIGPAPIIFVAPDEVAEARWVAEQIVRLLDTGEIEQPGEVGVLYRTNQQAEVVVVEFRRRRLPYTVRGSGDLLASKVVRTALAYLRLAVNPGDSAALADVVNTPPRGLARLTSEIENRGAVLSELPALAASCGRRGVESAALLVKTVERLNSAAKELDVTSLLDMALETSGFAAWLSSQPNRNGQQRLLQTMRRLLPARSQQLSDWLADLAIGEDPAQGQGEHDCIVLSTIHRAKGDEWRVAFVLGMEEGLLPHMRALLSTPEALEDEQRIAYVAVSRARERLYLSYCRHRQGSSNAPRRPSRFLHGLPAISAPAA